MLQLEVKSGLGRDSETANGKHDSIISFLFCLISADQFDVSSLHLQHILNGMIFANEH